MLLFRIRHVQPKFSSSFLYFLIIKKRKKKENLTFCLSTSTIPYNRHLFSLDNKKYFPIPFITIIGRNLQASVIPTTKHVRTLWAILLFASIEMTVTRKEKWRFRYRYFLEQLFVSYLSFISANQKNVSLFRKQVAFEDEKQRFKLLFIHNVLKDMP